MCYQASGVCVRNLLMYRHSPLQPAATALKRTPAADIIGEVKVQSNVI